MRAFSLRINIRVLFESLEIAVIKEKMNQKNFVIHLSRFNSIIVFLVCLPFK